VCSLDRSQSGRNAGPAQFAHGPADRVGPPCPDPDPPEPDPTDRPTAAAEAELLGAVRAWLDTGGPTAADLAAWSRAFLALEAQEWPDHFRLELGPGPTAPNGEGGLW
jgi:hypothetical protein